MKIGDKIPENLGYNQDGKPIKASDFTGKKLALYFYPKDNTPGCTSQACSLRDNYNKLREIGYEVVGVSGDSEKSHQKFINKLSLPFPLIADTDLSLINQFGIWQEKSMMGKKYMGIVRTTFLIDEEGIIVRIIEGRKINTKDHANQIINS